MSNEMTLEMLLETAEVDYGCIAFEEGLKLLEELVARVESGALPLDQAMIAYERGVHLVAHLQEQLSGAEEKLKVLRRKSEGKGKPSESFEVREVE